MSSKISRWIGLVGIGATIALFQPKIAAKSLVTIADPAKAITEPNSVATNGRSDSLSERLRQRDESGVKNGFNRGISIDRLATVASDMEVELGQKVAATPRNRALKADDYLASATQKYERGDIQGALADLNQAIALNPKFAEAYYNRGLLKVQNLNDVQGALADYDRAIALTPKSALAYNNRGHLKYHKLNDVQGALDDLSKAIEVNSNFAGGYYIRGDLFYSTGNRSAAIVDFRKVAEIERSSAVGLIAQGVIQTQQGAHSQAIDLFNQAAKISPETGDIYKYSTSGSYEVQPNL